VCTAPAADDEKKYFILVADSDGLAIRVHDAMHFQTFAFCSISATTYDRRSLALRGLSDLLINRALVD
jgi:hypothetical protein